MYLNVFNQVIWIFSESFIDLFSIIGGVFLRWNIKIYKLYNNYTPITGFQGIDILIMNNVP